MIFDSCIYAIGEAQRADVSEEVSLGSGTDAVHPLLVGFFADLDRREEAPLAWSCPPSSYQGARDQGRLSIPVCGYVS